MTDKKHRGMDAKINHCMWAFVEYAAKCQPLIAVFESVRPAFTNGREMMLKLRDRLEAETGLTYTLHHVMHNAYDLGGAAFRPRYFWVASQVPFGVTYPDLPQKPVLQDVIGDLEGMSLTWGQQPYRRPASWWAEPVRSAVGTVDGHMNRDGLATQRAIDLLNMANERLSGWPMNWHIGKLAQEVYEQTGELPKSWSHMIEKLVRINFHMGFTSLTRWDMNRPGRVITGGALNLVLHPTESRCLTHRETARVMGFPDDWLIEPLRGNSGLAATWGKGITVQCGRWLGTQVINALNGEPGEVTGELIGDREYLANSGKISTKRLPSARSTTTVGNEPVIVKPAAVQVEPNSVERTYGGSMSEDVAAPAATSTGRGRPRPDSTKARDALAYELLAGEGLTNEDLAVAMNGRRAEGEPEISKGIAYLSIYRLRKENKVTKARPAGGGKFVWKHADAEAPATV